MFAVCHIIAAYSQQKLKLFSSTRYYLHSIRNKYLVLDTVRCIFITVTLTFSDFIWPFLPPYMGVIPNPKMTFIFPILCILVLIFPIFMIYFPKSEGKCSFPKSQIKSLTFYVFMEFSSKAQELDVDMFSLLVYPLRSRGKDGHSAAAQIVSG